MFGVPPVILPALERAGRYALGRSGFLSRWVTTPLGTVHAYDAPGRGALPPVVVLHGIGSAATPFGPILARVRRHASRVVAPDYPGHGFSETPREPVTLERFFEAVSTALDHLVEQPSLLVGNSLGGAMALRYALARPDRVRGLVLLSPAGAPSTDDEWRALRRTFTVRTASDARVFLQKLYHRPPWFVPFILHEFPTTFGRPVVRDLLTDAANDHAITPEELGALKMPILFLWGRSERLLPDSHYTFFERHLPSHAIVERPAGFGHCPHFDQPRLLSNRIVEFARGL